MARPKVPVQQWESGKFMDGQNGQYEAPTPAPNGGALTRAVTVLKNRSYTDFVIESDKYVITVEVSGGAHVVINSETKFAIEGQTLWFLDADGKRRKSKIQRQVLKEATK
jgi:hypothetical protein